MNVNHGLPGLVVGGRHGGDVHVGLRASINGDDVGICGSILAIAARTGVVQALIRLDQDRIAAEEAFRILFCVKFTS